MGYGTNANNWRLLDKRAIKEVPDTEGVFKMARETTLIIVSVKEGYLDVWLGDQTGRTSDPPDFHFGQNNYPVEVFIPGGTADITYKTGGTEEFTLATILVGGT
jgi:hypothetical protein